MAESASSKAGIQTSKSGERHIPSSTRADGSTRKEIKIRPGYRPPEDVEVYKNRTAEAWKTKGSGGVPGAAVVNDKNISKPNNKNAKKREARKRAKENQKDLATATDTVDETADSANSASSLVASIAPPPIETLNGPEAIMDDTEKQSRNLRKKLRQARELKEKREGGELLLPDQLAKVLKINELIRQMELMGLDANGEPKPDMQEDSDRPQVDLPEQPSEPREDS
ncbi:MAG: hypothetical protein M1814_006920 [Vezdaea aestivalis]|nr:MAG: hypothetical protein M1814_006920 [Vezdaea aestivalis]